MSPELSVVIVSYNCRALLDDCLRSLQEERERVGLEVFVVDNDSRDGTPQHVPQAYPWVHFLPAGGNVGFPRANNLALERARGRQVLLLNPDTVVPAGALRDAVDELDRRPDTGMLGLKLVQPDGRLDHACKRGFPSPEAAFYYASGIQRLFPHHPRFAAYTAGHVGEDEVSEVDAVNGAYMQVKREALDDVGVLDERFWMYWEDVDWCRRFWDAGWKVVYWPRREILHVKGGSSTSFRSWKVNWAFHHSLWLLHDKHLRAQSSPLASALLWLGVYARLGLLAAVSAAGRARRRRVSTRPRT